MADRSEIGKVILVRDGSEPECKCPVYRVAEGKVPGLIGENDRITIQTRECANNGHRHI